MALHGQSFVGLLGPAVGFLWFMVLVSQRVSGSMMYRLGQGSFKGSWGFFKGDVRFL